MALYYSPKLIRWLNYCDAWREWASQRPSRWHLVKYHKWLHSEPEYGKENKR